MKDLLKVIIKEEVTRVLAEGYLTDLLSKHPKFKNALLGAVAALSLGGAVKKVSDMQYGDVAMQAHELNNTRERSDLGRRVNDILRFTDEELKELNLNDSDLIKNLMKSQSEEEYAKLLQVVREKIDRNMLSKKNQDLSDRIHIILDGV